MGAALFTILMEGCSSSSKQPEIDHEKIKQFASRGYDSGIKYATLISKSSLNTGNGFCQITIIQPSREGKYPLVIYMPGLGESSDAGADMRYAWAKSGYVVLSIQPLEDDANVWSSKAARRGDFEFIRHERYSSEVISERLNVLNNSIEYLKQRVGSGDSIFQHVELPVHIKGVIALSPYADFSGSEPDVRYRNISMPVLSITSNTDSDAHGNVPPSLHQVPFQYMPLGNKYLLLLAGTSHSVIAMIIQLNQIALMEMATLSNLDMALPVKDRVKGGVIVVAKNHPIAGVILSYLPSAKPLILRLSAPLWELQSNR